MATILLKARLALELPAINQALDALLQTLPAPVRPAASHTVNAGGKRLRPLLTVLAARLFGCQDKRVYTLGCTLEMLHAATLMHDDVIDSATTRRGKPACHAVYGTTETILAGDALLSEANACVASFGDPRLCSVFSRATADTCAGEILELHAMHNTGLTQEEYAGIMGYFTSFIDNYYSDTTDKRIDDPVAQVDPKRDIADNGVYWIGNIVDIFATTYDLDFISPIKNEESDRKMCPFRHHRRNRSL